MELASPEAPPVPILPRHRDIIIALILPCYRPIRLLFSIPWGPDGHWFSTLDMATSRSNSNPPSIRHPEQQFRYSDPILLSPHHARPCLQPHGTTWTADVPSWTRPSPDGQTSDSKVAAQVRIQPTDMFCLAQTFLNFFKLAFT